LKGKPFYDGIIFHRVEKGFVIQGGDPLGNGSGDPGYVFRDEITELKHDKTGTVAMANSGPNTNGSQFYITLKPTPDLDGMYNIFGYVIDGMDVVNAIERNDEMTKISIIRKGEEVKKFNAIKVFNDYFKSETERQKNQSTIEAEKKKAYLAKYKAVMDKKVAYFTAMKKSATKLTSGLQYVVLQKSKGEKPKDGSSIYINYSGFLEDGTLFDTSDPEAAKLFGTFDEVRAKNKKGYAPLPFKVGGYNQLIPGFIEGIGKLKIGEKAILFIPSSLGFGEQGAGNVIPPNANIIFEVEVKDKI